MTLDPLRRSPSPATPLLLPCCLLSACMFGDEGPSAVRTTFAFGQGDVEHRTKGTALDGKTDANYFAVGLEAIGQEGIGLGFRFEGIGSDDQLFVGAGAGSPSEAADGELFVHGTLDMGDDAARFPVRLGLFGRGYTLQENATGDEISWGTFGPRLEVAPDVAIVHDGGFRWSLTGRLGGAFGGTVVSVTGAPEDWSTVAAMFDVALGTRLELDQFHLDVGWLSRNAHYAESDPANSAVVLAADSEFTGFVLTLGARF